MPLAKAVVSERQVPYFYCYCYYFIIMFIMLLLLLLLLLLLHSRFIIVAIAFAAASAVLCTPAGVAPKTIAIGLISSDYLYSHHGDRCDYIIYYYIILYYYS